MSNEAFIARQPIVDGNHQLMAYELLFRHSAHAQSARIESDVDAGIAVISNTLCNMGTEWLLKGKLAFVNMGSSMLTKASLPFSNHSVPMLHRVLEMTVMPASTSDSILALWACGECRNRSS